MSAPPRNDRSGPGPLGMGLVVLTCAVAGVLLQRLLADEGEEPTREARAVPPVRGAPIDSAPPATEPEPEPQPAPEPHQPAPVPEPVPEPGAAQASTAQAPAGDTPAGDTPAGAPEPPEPLPRLGTPPTPETPAEQPGDAPLYRTTSFAELGEWTYEFPDPDRLAEREDPVPQAIRDWSGTRVAIQGFMVPVKLEGEDQVTEFLLVKDQFACCFGVVPKMNQWIHVVMAPGRSSSYLVDVPITVRGVFDASELIEDGLVMSLYRITADAVDEPAFLR